MAFVAGLLVGIPLGALAFLCFILYRLFFCPSRGRRTMPRMILLKTAGIALLWMTFNAIVQSFEPSDVVGFAAGVASAIACVWLWRRTVPFKTPIRG